MILERRIKKRNLNQLDILITDTSNEFLQVFDVPEILPQGRSAFSVNGSEFLKTKSPTGSHAKGETGFKSWTYGFKED